MIEIDLSLHSYSMRLHYLHDDDYNVFRFIDDAVDLGFTGVNISLSGPDNAGLPPHRHLGGDSEAHIAKVGEYLKARNMSVEIDTDGTDMPRLVEATRVAKGLGARVIRTFTHHDPGPEMFADTLADLQNIAPVAEAEDVVIALENHEEFTSGELVEIMENVPGRSVLLLYDYGNGLPVLEEPEVALSRMLDWVASCHMKDCVVVQAENGPLDVPCSMGVPIGEGAIDLAGLTKGLVEGGLRRITLQNVWGYHVPFGKLRSVDLSDPRLGRGVFRYANPPFDPAHICFDPEVTLEVGEFLKLERAALETARTNVGKMLAGIDCAVVSGKGSN